MKFHVFSRNFQQRSFRVCEKKQHRSGNRSPMKNLMPSAVANVVG